MKRRLVVCSRRLRSGGAALDRSVAGPGGKSEEGADGPTRRESAAPQTRSLGTAGSWTAYASGEKPGRICYLVGRPQKTDSAGVARKAPVAMVTHRPSENISNVVSFVEGYPLKTGSDAALEIDDKKFDLFTNDDSAWARTAELDRAIVSALAQGTDRHRQGHPAQRQADHRYLFAGRVRQGAGADRRSMRDQPPRNRHRAVHSGAATGGSAGKSRDATQKAAAHRLSPKKLWNNMAKKKKQKSQQAKQ